MEEQRYLVSNGGMGIGETAETSLASIASQLKSGSNLLASKVTHWSPNDGSVTYTSSSTITCSGFDFTVADANCTVALIGVKASGDDYYTFYSEGVDSVGFTATGNVITINGATPFASGDSYIVGLIEQEKSYDSVATAKKIEDVSPKNEKREFSTDLIDESNSTTTVERYLDMSKYDSCSLQFIVGGGTCTLTLEGTLQDDETPAASCTYFDITNDLYGAATVTASDLLMDDAGTLGCLKYLKVKVVTSSGTCTVHAVRKVL